MTFSTCELPIARTMKMTVTCISLKIILSSIPLRRSLTSLPFLRAPKAAYYCQIWCIHSSFHLIAQRSSKIAGSVCCHRGFGAAVSSTWEAAVELIASIVYYLKGKIKRERLDHRMSCNSGRRQPLVSLHLLLLTLERTMYHQYHW